MSHPDPSSPALFRTTRSVYEGVATHGWREATTPLINKMDYEVLDDNDDKPDIQAKC